MSDASKYTRTPCMGEDEGIESLAFRICAAVYMNDMYPERWQNTAEMLAHEVAHALSLDIPIDERVSYQVAERIRQVTEEAADYNEALTLASEDYVLRALGITRDRELLARAAKTQRVCPHVFNAVWGSPEATALGQRVMRYIGRRLMRRRPHA